MTSVTNLYAPIGMPQSHKILQIVPKTAKENERNSKLFKKTQIDQFNLHIFKEMEASIMFLQILGVFAIVYLGTVVVSFFGSRYFSFGVPVLVSDVTIKIKWKYWLNMAFIAWDRVFSFITSYYIGKWRNIVLFDETAVPEKLPSYSTGMFVLISNHIMTWLRYPVMIVFVYAQIDFALAYAVPDIIIGFATAITSVETLSNTCELHPKTRAEREVQTKEWKWNLGAGVTLDAVWIFTVAEYVHLFAYIMMFLGTGILGSNYFAFHPPFTVFGRVFKQKEKYAFIIIFVFIDQILASLLNVIAGPYISGELLNESQTTRYGKNGARFIYLSRKMFQWIRTMFVLNFTLSQFIFFLFIIVADTAITVWLTDRALKGRLIKYMINNPTYFPVKPMEQNSPAAKSLDITPLGIVCVVWIEMLIIIFVMIFQFDVHERLEYFNFPPPLRIFDVIMNDMGAIIFVFLYVCFDRVILSLTTEITYPYINNILTHCDAAATQHYNKSDIVGMMAINDVTGWIRRIVGYNFLLSNVSLVIIEGVTDIVVSWAILERYLEYKRKNNQNKYISKTSEIHLEIDELIDSSTPTTLYTARTAAQMKMADINSTERTAFLHFEDTHASE